MLQGVRFAALERFDGCRPLQGQREGADMQAKSVGLILLFTLTTAAQAQDPGERFYQAIRNDDLTALRTLVRDASVNAKDVQGQTPLMLAAAFGSAEAVQLLLTNGADARAASNGGVTALHWAAPNAAKVKMLLGAGADVHAVSQLGRTPLLVAASANGTAESVRLLLAKGAKVNVTDTVGMTPLTAAALVNDTEVVKLLVENGAEVTVPAATGAATTPLMAAATNGNAENVRLLLDRGANPKAISADSAATVKNGPIQFGRVTALHFAVLSGNPDVVRRLLSTGALVDAQDIRGMTPLMMAIGTDRPDMRIIRMLLDAGASTEVRSKADESVKDWARKFQHPRVLAALKLRPDTTRTAALPQLTPVADRALTPAAAVERSLPPLRDASGKMLTNGGCVACHAQPLTGIAVNLARSRGWTTATAANESAQASAQQAAVGPALLQLRDGGGLPDGLLYVNWLLANDQKPASRATDAAVHYVAAKQRQDGSWEGIGGSRAPMQDGNFSRTALAIHALVTYATPARRAEYASRVQRAATWLSSHPPVSTEDRTMQLLGLHWAKAEPKLRDTRVRELLAQQRSDGGWAQTPYLGSDAYATGQVLYTLRQLGVPAGNAALQGGTAYLQRSQAADGTWRVVNRAMKLQPYFQGGFPYDHDQWISHAGSAWAVMGLASAGLDAAPASASAR
jgi:ankyrin repeat protein